jgi:hypothetical protein
VLHRAFQDGLDFVASYQDGEDEGLLANEEVPSLFLDWTVVAQPLSKPEQLEEERADHDQE